VKINIHILEHLENQSPFTFIIIIISFNLHTLYTSISPLLLFVGFIYSLARLGWAKVSSCAAVVVLLCRKLTA